MADWTPPPWAQLVAGKAWTDEKAAAAFENLLAVLEGAPDTPRLRIGALQRLTAGDEHRVTSENAAASYGPGGGSGGDRLVAFVFIQAGTVRAIVNRSGNAGSCNLIRRRNRADTSIQVPTGTGDSAPVDFAVLPGDALILNLTISGGSGSGSLTCYVRLFTGGEDIFPVVGASIVGNTYNA